MHAYPSSLLSVAVASDGLLFESDVYAASNLNNSPPNSRYQTALPMSPSVTSAAGSYKSRAGSSSKRSSTGRSRKWGERAVLVLIGVRLGIDGVNPVYYESIKVSAHPRDSPII